ncbi:RICIN domain-containing protein [Streptomyces sp. MUSC 14]|uniref:RICIN domain-containing protein n=1 Tax=Streptomyces sp. MUSC 14 TaxID=1354889 RepID=UPI0015A58A6F|nr:RICIN domain-containing protein [Streptomyces sp. MUSC 14]
MRKLMGMVAGSAAVAGSLLFMGTGTASAMPIPPGGGGTVSLHNEATGKCVDDSSYGLRDFGCQNPTGPYAGFQQFALSQQSDGTWVFQNVATGKCVDDSNYGLRDFGCQDQSGPYAGFQRFRFS